MGSDLCQMGFCRWSAHSLRRRRRARFASGYATVEFQHHAGHDLSPPTEIDVCGVYFDNEFVSGS